MNPEHVELLTAELRSAIYEGKTVDEAYALFHASELIEQQQVPIAVSIQALMGMFSQQSIANLVAWPSLPDLRDKILQGDVPGILLWGNLLVLGGVITQDEFNAVYAYLQQTDAKEVRTQVVPRVAVVFAGIAGAPNKIELADFTTAWNAR